MTVPKPPPDADVGMRLEWYDDKLAWAEPRVKQWQHERRECIAEYASIVGIELAALDRGVKPAVIRRHIDASQGWERRDGKVVRKLGSRSKPA